VTWLVVFDTWVLNWDRHPADASRRPNYDNVFLSTEGASPGRFILKAMDHTHCFGCRAGELSRRLADLEHIRDERVYGLFPGFRPLLREEEAAAASQRLCALTRVEVEKIVASVPREWDVSEEVRAKLCDLIVRRAAFVAERIITMLPQTP
jgi:hypothetical protein